MHSAKEIIPFREDLTGPVHDRLDQFAFAYDLSTPLWVFDIDNCRIAKANLAACRLWKADNEAELTERDMSIDMSSTVAKRLKQYQADFLISEARFHEMWTLYPDGEPISLMAHYSGYRLSDGRMAMLCEVTGQAKDTPDNLRSTEALLHTDVMIALYCLNGQPLYMNPAARNAVENQTQALSDMFVDRCDYDLLRFELEKTGEHRMVAKVSAAAGHCWFDISAKVCSDTVTGEPAILATAVDVSELKNARDRARYLANRDQLTGCFNRSFLKQRISELSNLTESCALLYFDVDRFKQINDRFGHETGDAVLKTLVRRAKRAIRKSDIIARLGGDEFVILFEDTPDRETFSQVVSRLMLELSLPIQADTTRINVTVSMGIAPFVPGEKSFTRILREADIALYASKQAGRNTLTYFNEDLGKAAQERDRIEIELKRAIEQNQFTLHYQPRVDLKTGRVTAAEALVRWQHPTRGLVMPNDFIPVCEETGMIEELGQHVIAMGCETAFAWARAGMGLQLSINISPRQFADKQLMNTLSRYAEMPGFPSGQIELELTENVLIGDHDRIAEKLEAITRMGYRIAIDDFGMGYSNLSYISRFPLTCLKIDRSFVSQLPKTGPIISLIFTLARQIGAVTVAEGVETQDEHDWLKGQDCDQVQGYFFSRPVPLDQFLDVVTGINGGD